MNENLRDGDRSMMGVQEEGDGCEIGVRADAFYTVGRAPESGNRTRVLRRVCHLNRFLPSHPEALCQKNYFEASSQVLQNENRPSPLLLGDPLTLGTGGTKFWASSDPAVPLPTPFRPSWKKFKRPPEASWGQLQVV